MYRAMTDGCPDGFYNYFLVRQRGIHPASGEKFTPVTVHKFDDELYSVEDELHPKCWSKNGDFRQGPTTKVSEADLEWHPLPE